MSVSLSVLVLNYNGEDLLKECLPAVVQAAENSGINKCEVILVDNQSVDESCSWTQSYFPCVKIFAMPNHYLYSLNTVAQQISSDLILILNNDISPERYSFAPLVETLLHDKNTFSVTPLLLRFDRETLDTGRRWGEFRRGFLHHTSERFSFLAVTLYATGCALLTRRSDFLGLGGFDRLYWPAYWEDLDLGYKAWKCGFTNLYQPASIMYHMGSASMKKKGRDWLEYIHLRNSWLFTWRNVTNTRILKQNTYWTLRYYLSASRERDRTRQLAFRDALKRFPLAWHGRHETPRPHNRTDLEICAISRILS